MSNGSVFSVMQTDRARRDFFEHHCNKTIMPENKKYSSTSNISIRTCGHSLVMETGAGRADPTCYPGRIGMVSLATSWFRGSPNAVIVASDSRTDLSHWYKVNNILLGCVETMKVRFAARRINTLIVFVRLSRF